MRTDLYKIWRLEFLLVHPWEWKRRVEKYPWLLRDYEVLDLWHAKLALGQIAREPRAREVVRELAEDVLRGADRFRSRPPHGSDEACRAVPNALVEGCRARGKPPRDAFSVRSL